MLRLNQAFLNFKHFSQCVLLAGLCFSVYAHADQDDALNFVAGVSSQHDNNIFKSETNEESERITSVFAGLRFDRQYSLQRFKANLMVRNNRYNNNDFLNFTSKNYDLAWLWSLTPRFTGTISASRDESLNNYNDFRNNTVLSVRTSQNQLFQADYAPGGGWHFLGGVSRNTLKNSTTFNQVADFSANSLDLGVKYDFSSGSSITAMNHVRKGNFDDRQVNRSALLDSGYKENEFEVRLGWLVTAKSQLNFVTSYLRRDHDNFSQRDYSGLQGSASYLWSPTAKINVAFSLQSNLSTFQSDTDSYTRTNAISISPSYQLSDKVKILAALNLSQRNFLGRGTVDGRSRSDDVRSASIGVEWTPLRYLNLGFNIQRVSQDSNIDGFGFDDTVANASANVLF